MTSDDLYKVLTDAKSIKYLDYVRMDLARYAIPEYAYSGNLKELIVYKERLLNLQKDIRNYVVPTLEFNVAQAITEHFSAEVLDYARRKAALEDEIKAEYNELESAYKEECEAVERDALASVAPIKQKHDALLSYKDKLRNAMEHYGITPTDTSISSDISREEFEALLDTALPVCAKVDGRFNGLLQKVLSPLTDEVLVASLYLTLLLLVSWLLLPFLGVLYLAAMYVNTRTMYHQMDSLRIAESLMHTVDFNKYIPEGEYVKPVLNTSELDVTAKERLDQLASDDPKLKIEAECSKFKTTEGLAYVSRVIEEVQNAAHEMYNEACAEIDEKVIEIVDLTEEECKKIKRFGEYMNSSTVMDTKYLIGYDKGTIPVYRDFGLTNINYVGTYGDTLLDTLKVMFVNAFMSVRANSLEVTIFDEEYLGQAFSEFITAKSAPYVTIESKDFNKVQDTMFKHASENILSIKTQTISEFNKTSEELGMVTRTYYLYIFLTGLGDKLEENKPFMEFLKYSAIQGVIVWTVYAKQLTGPLNVKPPLEIDEGELVHYDFGLGARAVATYEYALENNKQKALDYRKAFLLKYLPEDTWWAKSSTKQINIHLGLVDGDPSKAYLHYFDDKNVHFLLGGATGAGKSVAIDCTLQTMIHEYAPDELQLVYIDMKNAEVAKYTKDGYSLIPHAIIVAGTTDGEYCLSIFDWALEEMLRRMTICRKYGVQKVEDLRKKFDDSSREGYDPEVHIPRIVILIDEFQVMFDTSRIPSKIITKIDGRITSLVKLARAASIHLWFTSQEMSGTLSKNVLDNFSMRGALRCTKEISSTLIGNEASGTIKEKVGWMYSNDSAGQDKNANKLWRVPFAPIDDLMQGINELQEKAKKENRLVLRAKFFDEKQGRTVKDFEQAYADLEAFKEPHFFVMGERTVYSTKTTPFNFRLAEDDKENIIIGAFERQDTMDLIATMIDNINKKGEDASMLISCCDKDTSYLLNLEQYQPEGWEDFLKPSYPTEEILLDLTEIAEAREEDGVEDAPVLYIFCLLWEKREGISVDEKYKQQEEFQKLVARLNAVKVHFIFVSRSKGLPGGVVSLCNHKICAKADEKLALQLTGDTVPFKFPSPNADEACFALYCYGSDSSKFKIYRHTLERKLEAREL